MARIVEAVRAAIGAAKVAYHRIHPKVKAGGATAGVTTAIALGLGLLGAPVAEEAIAPYVALLLPVLVGYIKRS